MISTTALADCFARTAHNTHTHTHTHTHTGLGCTAHVTRQETCGANVHRMKARVHLLSLIKYEVCFVASTSVVAIECFAHLLILAKPSAASVSASGSLQRAPLSSR